MTERVPLHRRFRRPDQRVVDLAFIVLAAVATVASSGVLVGETHETTGAVVLDQTVAGLACGLLWWRRRRPVLVAVVIQLVGLPSHAMAGPGLASLFTVAVHCRTRTLVLLVLMKLLLIPVNVDQRPESSISDATSVTMKLVMITAVVSWGLSVKSHRRLRATLYEQAQRRTREAVAREMHDVLAHRLSLLSVHAGALEYHPDAPPEQVRQAAGVIRESAHLALEELRDVIGVLRAEPGEDGAPERPQPTLADLPRLADESRRAGTPVRLDQRAEADGAPPETVGRTGYRVVQEGLTNVRKHAPGAEALVSVAGGPGAGLTVRISNRLAAPPPGPGVPGAGAGLTGLTERVALAGGRLTHRRTGDDFVLTAWLPWPT
ncbi:histidine kinase [Streptomyces sp. DSM 44915]|uniref:histidine kinase n=1 Tax=Streptomyces chisholmiae TaxID=3075540 RepID=A0ABU2JUT6_9ACTN|nr:histidine kinase [Streptomyces sp. DSM 44915]MDT0268715.1 histidine kinase [Streptomyces sp. DSM 44915]